MIYNLFTQRRGVTAGPEVSRTVTRARQSLSGSMCRQLLMLSEVQPFSWGGRGFGGSVLAGVDALDTEYWWFRCECDNAVFSVVFMKLVVNCGFYSSTCEGKGVEFFKFMHLTIIEACLGLLARVLIMCSICFVKISTQ